MENNMAKKELSREQLEKAFMEEFDKFLDRSNSAFLEDDEMKDEGVDAEEAKGKEMDDEMVDDGEEAHAFKKIDEIMDKVNFGDLSNDERLDVLEILIDSAQNSDEEAEEFDDFLEKAFDLLDGYQSSKEEEEEEPEMGEDEGEEEMMPDEEMPEEE